MKQNTQIECSLKNPNFATLLSSLNKLVVERKKQEFSDSFNKTITTYNLDYKNWQKNFKGKYSVQIIDVITLLLALWQQIQEEDLPFSYVKKQLDQKTFEEELKKSQFKITLIKDKTVRLQQ